jgi:hypothetical protein
MSKVMSDPEVCKPIGLAELIYRVKQELLSPSKLREDPVPLFAVEEIELEVAITVSREGEAGLNLQVLSLGAGLSRADAQTVRVTLKPLRNRDEMIHDLRQRDPQLFEHMAEVSLYLIKGAQKGDSPLEFP